MENELVLIGRSEHIEKDTHTQIKALKWGNTCLVNLFEFSMFDILFLLPYLRDEVGESNFCRKIEIQSP